MTDSWPATDPSFTAGELPWHRVGGRAVGPARRGAWHSRSTHPKRDSGRSQRGRSTDLIGISNFSPSQPLLFLSRVLKDAVSLGSRGSAEAKDGNQRRLRSRLAAVASERARQGLRGPVAHTSPGDPLCQGGRKTIILSLAMFCAVIRAEKLGLGGGAPGRNAH